MRCDAVMAIRDRVRYVCVGRWRCARGGGDVLYSEINLVLLEYDSKLPLCSSKHMFMFIVKIDSASKHVDIHTYLWTQRTQAVIRCFTD